MSSYSFDGWLIPSTCSIFPVGVALIREHIAGRDIHYQGSWCKFCNDVTDPSNMISVDPSHTFLIGDSHSLVKEVNNHYLEHLDEYRDTPFTDGDLIPLMISGKVHWVFGNGEIHYLHELSECYGKPCPAHNPSNHYLRNLLTHLNHFGRVLRFCQHQVYVDPDELLDWEDYSYQKCSCLKTEENI